MLHFLLGRVFTKIFGNIVHRRSVSSPLINLFNHIFTNMYSCIFILYFDLYSNTTLYVLLLKLLHWPLGAHSFGYCAPLTSTSNPQQCVGFVLVFLSTSFISDTRRCSRLIFYNFSHFFKIHTYTVDP